MRAWRLFSELSTQWRTGAGGTTGLDYNPLFVRMERMRLPDDEWEDLFQGVRLIEQGALAAMHPPKNPPADPPPDPA